MPQDFARTTNANGFYSIGGLPKNKAYKITLTVHPGLTIEGSASQTTPVLGSGQSDNNVNFTVLPPVYVL